MERLNTFQEESWGSYRGLGLFAASIPFLSAGFSLTKPHVVVSDSVFV